MVIVVKIGGSIISKGLTGVLEDLGSLAQRNHMILVHGGASIVTQVAERMGKQQVFITSPDGIRSRYTDLETAEIYAMVMTGKIGKALVASLNKLGHRAVGVSGVDGGLIKAARKAKLIVVDERGRRRAIEGGYTGRIMAVEKDILQMLLEKGMIPVISPIALGEANEILNVDSDRAAAHVAAAASARSLVFLTNVPGVLLGGKVLSSISLGEAREMVKRVGPGMDKKLMASVEALEGGVGECLIASGEGVTPISSALSHKSGTVVLRG